MEDFVIIDISIYHINNDNTIHSYNTITIYS